MRWRIKQVHILPLQFELSMPRAVRSSPIFAFQHALSIQFYRLLLHPDQIYITRRRQSFIQFGGLHNWLPGGCHKQQQCTALCQSICFQIFCNRLASVNYHMLFGYFLSLLINYCRLNRGELNIQRPALILLSYYAINQAVFIEPFLLFQQISLDRFALLNLKAHFINFTLHGFQSTLFESSLITSTRLCYKYYNINKEQQILNQNILIEYLQVTEIMAQGKNKKNFNKKGQKKKTTDPLSRKEWFQLRAPAPFQPESFGFTCANRTQGLKKVEDQVKGRVVTSNQADLAKNQDAFAWRKIKLIVDDTRGRDAITSFYGVDMTRDQLSALIKKRKTLIQAIQDCKSQDGYVIRVFVIAFTKESQNQKKKTNYALASQQKEIRRRINEIVSKQVSQSNATKLLSLFTSEAIEKKITKEVSAIYPVKNVRVRKIKVIQRPKIDATKLAQMHENDKRNLSKAQGRRPKGEKGQRVEKKKLEDETVNLLSREE